MRRPRTLLPLSILAAAFLLHGDAAAQEVTLVQALDAAFDHHPTLQAAEARVTGARHDTYQARATRFPTVAVSYGVTRFDQPMVTTPIHAFDPSNFPDFDRSLAQGSLGLRYTLLDWGARGNAVEASDAVLGAEVASSRVVVMELIERVTSAYLSVESARAVDAAAEALVTALSAELARVEQNLAAGTAADVEVLRASTALQDARARRTTASGAVGLAERSLARLTGIDAELLSGATLGAPAADDSAPLAPAEAGSPLVERAERRADAAGAQLSAARGSRLPRLELTGTILDYGTLDSAHSFEWQAGVQLSWTLFAGGARRAGIRSAEAEVRAARNDVDAVSLEVMNAIDASRTAIESADARRTVLEASVEQWRELARIEALRLDSGIGVQRDLLEAQSGLFEAEAGLVAARAESLIARLRLARASGVLSRAWVAETLRGTP